MIWSDLFPRILPHVPGCPEPLVEDVVRQTAIAFCRETKVWEEQLENVYPVAGITKYALNLPDETSVLSIASAVQGKTSTDEGESLTPTLNVFNALTFDSSMSPDNGPIEVRAILKPSEDSSGMPDRIGYGYDTAIIHGAIASLVVMPKKDWSAPELAGFHQGIYKSELTEARLERAMNGNEAPLRTSIAPLI